MLRTSLRRLSLYQMTDQALVAGDHRTTSSASRPSTAANMRGGRSRAGRGGTRARAGAAGAARLGRAPLAERRAAILALPRRDGAAEFATIVPELAWQMGRPVRYQGELRGFEERAREWPRSPKPRSRRHRPARGPASRASSAASRVGLVLVDRALELSVSHRRQHRRAGADRRQRGAAQALRADPARRRALRRGLRVRRASGRALRAISSSIMRRRRGCSARGLVDHATFTGSVEGGRAVERAAAGSLHRP